MASRVLRQIRFSAPPSVVSCRAPRASGPRRRQRSRSPRSPSSQSSRSPGTMTPGSPSAPPVPGFLAEALGAEETARPLVERPRKGVTVELGERGYTVTRGGASVALAREGAGADAPWRRFEHGVVRATAFGSETVTIDGTTTEHFLTVRERQGPTTWRWSLDTRGGEPRVTDDGTVELVGEGGRVAPLTIRPVQILDAKGKDVTPRGTAWSVQRQGQKTWLALELNDAGLPLPYVIDPATDYPSPLYLSSTASLDTNSWKLVTAVAERGQPDDDHPGRSERRQQVHPLEPRRREHHGHGRPGRERGRDRVGSSIPPAPRASRPGPGTSPSRPTSPVPASRPAARSSRSGSGRRRSPAGRSRTSRRSKRSRTTPPRRTSVPTSTSPRGRSASRCRASRSLPTSASTSSSGASRSPPSTRPTAQRLQLILRVNQGVTRIAPTAADDGAPSNVLSLTGATGAHLSGSTLYYKSNAAGSFQLRNTITDVGGTGTASGAYSSLYPAHGDRRLDARARDGD